MVESPAMKRVRGSSDFGGSCAAPGLASTGPTSTASNSARALMIHNPLLLERPASLSAPPARSRAPRGGEVPHREDGRDRRNGQHPPVGRLVERLERPTRYPDLRPPALARRLHHVPEPVAPPADLDRPIVLAVEQRLGADRRRAERQHGTRQPADAGTHRERSFPQRPPARRPGLEPREGGRTPAYRDESSPD